MFSKRMLEEGTAVALQQGEQLLAKLDAHAASGEPIDLQKAFFAFTMDTFAEIAFGAALDSQNTDHRFTQAFDTAQQLCNDRFGRPWFSLLKLLKTPSEAAIEREVGIMRGFALGIVQGRRRQKESGEPLGADLVSRFLASPSGGDMTDDELIDVVLNFIIAGRDTTACALSWASLRLLRAEDVQARMNAEVEAEIGKVVGVGKRPQLQELPASEVFNLVHKSLPYTRAVVSEALRLHPSVPKDGKYAVAADTLPDGTTVPRGCMMIWSNYVSAAALFALLLEPQKKAAPTGTGIRSRSDALGGPVAVRSGAVAAADRGGGGPRGDEGGGDRALAADHLQRLRLPRVQRRAAAVPGPAAGLPRDPADAGGGVRAVRGGRGAAAHGGVPEHAGRADEGGAAGDAPPQGRLMEAAYLYPGWAHAIVWALPAFVAALHVAAVTLHGG